MLLDIQADLLASLATRVVVPLISVKRHQARPMTRLNPTTRLRGTEYVLLFQELSAMPASALGAAIGSLKSRRAEMIAAIDLLLTGS